MSSPTVLTVIVNYRTPDLTLAALEGAVREMEGLVGGVVVVDNQSEDGSFERLVAAVAAAGLDRGGRVRVLASGRNGGFGAGVNFGMAAGLPDGGVPDYVYLLNSDACPGPGAVRLLIERLEADPGLGFAGSYIHGIDGTPHETAFRFPSLAGEFEDAASIGLVSRLLADRAIVLPLPTGDIEVDWVCGASVAIRRTMLDAIGTFDEGFFLYFDETDLTRRAKAAGWRTLYVRDSAVAHHGSASTGMATWSRVPTYWLDSRRRYFVKHHGSVYFHAATLLRLVGGVLRRGKNAMRGKSSSEPRGILLDLAVHALRNALPGGQAAPPRRPPAAPVRLGSRKT